MSITAAFGAKKRERVQCVPGIAADITRLKICTDDLSLAAAGHAGQGQRVKRIKRVPRITYKTETGLLSRPAAAGVAQEVRRQGSA